ncbi:DUF4920 domain-containing protein [Aestuariivivens marinum]|uniref:DUF4920 domain-containing protein n=1 Tax=Aestuariivivens marinum TaxID=2913555 RepID=UPI001F580D2C|nr:DUF4920 domain-containing protein [Aestuariivivens marinum]
MKSLLLGLIAALLLNSCKNKEQNQWSNENMTTTEYASFGKVIISDDAIAAKSMATHYNKMQVGDSINSKMIATVIDVCQTKGCWMTLKLDGQSEVMVKFKDYGFFVPKDIKGETVIVNGFAYVEEQSVDDLRHYAKDAGKTIEEIEAITEPKRIFVFEADGVLLKQ